MWPFRPDRLTDVFPPEDLRPLLSLGDALGSALTIVELGSQGELERVDPERTESERKPDPFCTFFRHGKAGNRPAFSGANEACSQCEARLGRRLLQPPPGAAISVRDTGVSALRCHMGLTDYLAEVAVGGKAIAGLIAGRRVESEEDRLRIRKIVGKLGKLTRAEAEAEGAGDRLIEPADEKSRDRLVQEIPSIPLRSEDLERGLLRLARLLGRLAERGFERVRRTIEDGIVERIDGRRGDPPRQFAELRDETSQILDQVRDTLGVGFLALLASSPKDLDDPAARATLVAESGLGTGTARRLIEVDLSRLPPPPEGRETEVTRGVSAVNALARALEEGKECPPDLRTRLGTSIFAAPVEVGPHLRAVLCFGSPGSAVSPESGDLQFLSRVARAVSRRYYALAAELERRWLSGRLETEGLARKEAQATARELERTEGFSYFDARKILGSCLERLGGLARERGVEIDVRDCIERLTFRGDRRRITELFARVIDEGIRRTWIDPETKKGAPLRVFLKRSRTRLFFGAEAIGDYFGPRERRDLFARSGDDDGAPADSRGEGNRATRGEVGVGSLEAELETVRRHGGRLRVESERLHRLEKDRSRWLGKTTFLVDLQLPDRPPQPKKAPEAPARGSSRRGPDEPRGGVPELAPVVDSSGSDGAAVESGAESEGADAQLSGEESAPA